MVRVDEITILPRDNSLLVATHGRALGILDHLEPIQEYSAARASANDAHVFLPPTALQRKAKDDRDDEFWAIISLPGRTSRSTRGVAGSNCGSNAVLAKANAMARALKRTGST